MGKDKKRKKFNKKIVITLVLLVILICLFFLVNFLVPIKDITKDNISINLSTKENTGNSVIATVTTKNNYNIYYYIDYSVGEEQYYEDKEFSDEVEEISEDEDSSNTLNKISNTISNSVSNNNTSNKIINNTLNSNTTNSKINVKQISDNEYKKVINSKFEIENNGIVYLKYGRFGRLSSIPYVFEITNIDKTGPEIGEIETKSTYSSITVTVNAIDESQSNLQYFFRISGSNKYFSNGSQNTYTFSNLTTDETYTIYVKVSDKYGNESEAVTEATASISSNEEIAEKKVYHFKVNLATNTVTVYEKSDSGKYDKAIKAFICSTGKSTPKSGTYKISDRYRWRSLFGGVFGQYAVRIHGNILFHSVPYEKMYANTLEYEEYDKLGTSASMGCIRLCVRDAKWIYDNAKSGSTVQFYSDSSDPGPLGKPKSQKISDNKNRNWDPTDPDKHNPWLGGDGTVTKVKVLDENNNKIINNSIVNNVTNTNNNTINNTTTNSVTNKVENKLVINDVISNNWD